MLFLVILLGILGIFFFLVVLMGFVVINLGDIYWIILSRLGFFFEVGEVFKFIFVIVWNMRFF